MDVGQPKDFLTGSGLYLNYLQRMSVHQETLNLLSAEGGKPYVYDKLSTGEGICGPVLIHPSAKIGNNCRIGPNVVVGPNVVIGDGVRISKSVIMDRSQIGSFAWISSTIVGWNCHVGRWSRLEGTSVLGDDVSVADEVYVNGGSILPHKSISSNITEPQIIM